MKIVYKELHTNLIFQLYSWTHCAVVIKPRRWVRVSCILAVTSVPWRSDVAVESLISTMVTGIPGNTGAKAFLCTVTVWSYGKWTMVMTTFFFLYHCSLKVNSNVHILWVCLYPCTIHVCFERHHMLMKNALHFTISNKSSEWILQSFPKNHCLLFIRENKVDSAHTQKKAADVLCWPFLVLCIDLIPICGGVWLKSGELCKIFKNTIWEIQKGTLSVHCKITLILHLNPRKPTCKNHI